MMNEPLSTIMTTDVMTVNPNDPLQMAKEILFNNRIHHLPVVDGRKLVGIISTFDLVKLDRPFSEYERIKVKEVMTSKMATLEPTDKVGAAAEIFLENLFHGLPIINEEGELVGIVTTFDILKYEFQKEYPNQDLG